MQNRLEKLFEYSAVAVFFLLLFLIIINSQINSLIYGNTPGDVYQMYWNACHFANQIQAGNNPFYTQQLFFPLGSTLFLHTYTLIFGIFHLIIKNPVVAINTALAFNFIFTALGFYLLAGNWISNKLFRFAIAFISVYNGYFLSELGVHYNLILIAAVPWAIHFFVLAISKEKPLLASSRHFAWFIFLLSINFFMDYYAVFFVLYFCVLYLFYHWFFVPWIHQLNWKKISIAFGILIICHIISRLLFINGYDHRGGIWDSADIRQAMIPNLRNLYWPGSEIIGVNSSTENFVFLGFSGLCILLIAIGIFLVFKSVRANTGFFLFALLITLALVFPDTRYNGKHLFFWPNSLLHYIPFLDNMRNPSRFVEFYFIFSGLFILAIFETRLKMNALKAGALSVLIVVIYFIDFTQKPYQIIKQNELMFTQNEISKLENKVILNIPFGIKDGIHSWGWFSVDDFKLASLKNTYLLSGYISRLAENRWKQYYSDSFYSTLINWEQTGSLNWAQQKMQQALLSHKVDIVRLDMKKAGKSLHAMKMELDQMCVNKLLFHSVIDEIHYYELNANK
jgi:hypothetical protein